MGLGIWGVESGVMGLALAMTMMVILPVMVEGDCGKLLVRTRNHHPTLDSWQP